MRIAINAHLVYFENSFRNAGVSKYIYNLIKNLAEIDSKNEYFIFVNKNCPNFIKNKNFHFIKSKINTINPKTSIVWEQFILPRFLKRYKIDIFHSPMNIISFFCPVKSIVTINDLTFLKVPETHASKRNWYQKFFTRFSAKNANAIITYSKNTKEDIVSAYNACEEKIYPISLGPNVNKQKEKAKINIPLPEKYILFAGTIEPRKNLTRIFRAFHKIHDKISHKLVIAGAKGWLFDKTFLLAKRLNLQDKIIFTGHVSDEQLSYLYQHADFLIYPSLYEGFGLPALEAMSCACPVITSNLSSLPEVVGNAGILINPYDINEIADAMLRLAKSRSLRNKLAKLGLKQAKKFSWKKTAEQTLKIYEKVHGGGK